MSSPCVFLTLANVTVSISSLFSSLISSFCFLYVLFSCSLLQLVVRTKVSIGWQLIGWLFLQHSVSALGCLTQQREKEPLHMHTNICTHRQADITKAALLFPQWLLQSLPQCQCGRIGWLSLCCLVFHIARLSLIGYLSQPMCVSLMNRQLSNACLYPACFQHVSH